MPETKTPVKFVLPKDQARLLLDSLGPRDRLIAMIAAFCAMRWRDIRTLLVVMAGRPFSNRKYRMAWYVPIGESENYFE
jgi:hypothetical protein